ncbi:MAG: hypothetical protein QOI72_1372 [Solirubrobacterales bacterium]|nr:hypothetical protein [Solirubrobacterales bacterium]
MPRRLLALVVIALALVSSAGCADDVSPAARIGDTKIGNGAFLDEVAQWAGSKTLVAAVQIPSTAGSGPGSYATPFVDFVLSNRISFELHNAKFGELGLALSAQDTKNVRDGLFSDPAATEAVFKELSKAYGDRLVADVARQFAVSQALGDGYQAWVAEAFTKADVEVSPRYGTWDRASGQVVPPEGPTEPAGASTPTGL